MGVKAVDTTNQYGTMFEEIQILGIQTTVLPGGMRGGTYGPTALAAVGGTGNYRWAATGLPTAISLSSAGNMYGTPGATAASSISVNVTVTDASTNATVTKGYTLSLANPEVFITMDVLPVGTEFAPYSVGLTATGGNASYSWSAAGLPAGLSVSGSSIIGAPSAGTAGTYSVQLWAVDAAGSTSPAATVGLAINASSVMACPVASCTEYVRLGGRVVAIENSTRSLAISTSGTLPSANRSVAYSQQLVAVGGVGTVTWTTSSGAVLPAGITLSGSGVLSGTPPSPGSYQFQLQAQDSAPTPTVAKQIFTLNVFGIATTSLPKGAVGTTYTAAVTAKGAGTGGSYSWNSSSLPAGLSLASTTGVISGTPSAPGANPSVVLTVASGSLADSLTLPLPVFGITTSSLAGATVGTAYSQTLSAAQGTSPYTWSATGLPSGLLMSTGGVISGTPSAGTGPYSVGVQVLDSSSPQLTARQSLSIQVGTVSCSPSLGLTFDKTSLQLVHGESVVVTPTITRSCLAAGDTTVTIMSSDVDFTISPSVLSISAPGTVVITAASTKAIGTYAPVVTATTPAGVRATTSLTVAIGDFTVSVTGPTAPFHVTIPQTVIATASQVAGSPFNPVASCTGIQWSINNNDSGPDSYAWTATGNSQGHCVFTGAFVANSTSVVGSIDKTTGAYTGGSVQDDICATRNSSTTKCVTTGGSQRTGSVTYEIANDIPNLEGPVLELSDIQASIMVNGTTDGGEQDLHHFWVGLYTTNPDGVSVWACLADYFVGIGFSVSSGYTSACSVSNLPSDQPITGNLAAVSPTFRITLSSQLRGSFQVGAGVDDAVGQSAYLGLGTWARP